MSIFKLVDRRPKTGRVVNIKPCNGVGLARNKYPARNVKAQSRNDRAIAALRKYSEGLREID